MKKSRKISIFVALILSLCAAIAFGIVVSADDVPAPKIHSIYYGGDENNYNYKIDFEVMDDTMEATVVGCDVRFSNEFAPDISEPITVDDKIYTVTVIGKEAFKGDKAGTYLIGIKLPETLTTIEDGAFSGCGGLTSISLPNSVTYIGDHAFENSGLTSITLHEGIGYIGAYSFAECKAITSVSFPDSVKHIGEGAFKGDSGIVSLDLNKVESIGNSAFEGIGVKTLPKSDYLVSIGSRAFANSKLVVVRTGSNLSEVGDEAFATDTLTYFDIEFSRPDGMWGKNIFGTNTAVVMHKSDNLTGWGSCRGISDSGKWTDDPTEVTWAFTDDIVLDFEDSINNVISKNTVVYGSYGVGYTLYGNYDIGSGILSNAHAIVSAYSGNIDKPEIVIPEYVYYDVYKIPVVEVGRNVFSGLNGGYITIGEHIESVYRSSFADSEGLELYFRNVANVQVLEGSGTFSSCWPNAMIVVGNVKYGESNPAGNGNNIYLSHALDNHYNDMQGIYYYIDPDLGYAIVGDFTSGDDTAANTSRYKGSDYYSGTAGRAVIPDYVSYGNSYYRVVGLGRYSFYNCSALKHLELGAFIGEGVPEASEIGIVDNGTILDCSLRNCQFLANFSIDSRNTYYSTDGDILYALSKAGDEGYFPSKIIKAGVGVTSYDNRYSTVAGVEKYAFANCTRLTVFNFGEEQTYYIGEHAFNNTGLTEVKLPEGTTVEDYAFMNNYALKSVSIGADNLLGRFVFRNCYSIEAFESNSAKYVAVDGALYELFDETVGGNTSKYAKLIQFPAGKELTSGGKITVNSISALGSADIPVHMIEAYAFAYSQVVEATVGNNVYFVGKAAFENSTKLTKITLSKALIALGIEIESDPSKPSADAKEISYVELLNSGTFDRTKFDVYEREVFDGCNLLSRIVVDNGNPYNDEDDNAYYYADSNGILYNKDKTILLVYAPGITRLSYTVPNTVKEIGIEAFEDNVHLHRLTLPEDIERVGAKAFNGCTKLSSIYFRTIFSPALGEQVFNSTGVLSNDGDFTVYCIREPGEWYNNREEIWLPYVENVKKYVAIQEVPEQATPDVEMYLIYVVDSDGNYLPGMRVEYAFQGLSEGSEIRKYLATNDQGYAVITLPSDLSRLYDGNALSLIVTDENGIYYEFNKDKTFYLDLETGYSYVTLRSIPGVNGVSANNKDIDTGKVTLNTAGMKENETFTVVVSADWDSSATFIEMALIVKEDGKSREIGKMAYNAETKVVTLYRSGEEVELDPKDCVFKYNEDKDIIGGEFTFHVPREAVSGYDIDNKPSEYAYYAKLLTELHKQDMEKPEKIPTEEKLRVDLFFYEFKDSDSTCDWFFDDNNFAFGIEESVPLIGGFEMDIEMSIGNEAEEDDKIFSIIYEGDKAYFVVNFGSYDEILPENDTRDPGGLYEQLQDAADTVLEEMSGNASANFEHELMLQLAGVIEIEKSSLNGPAYAKRTHLQGNIKYEMELGKTFVVWYIPVRVELDFTAEGKIAITMYREDIDSSAEPGATFGISLEVEVRAGVGCSIVSIGIYGSASLDVVFEVFKSFYAFDVDVGWDAGVYAKLDVGFFKYTQRFSLISAFGGTTEMNFHYVKDKNASGGGVWALKRNNAETLYFSTLEAAVTYDLMHMDTSFVPLEDTDTYDQYDGAKPEIVSYGGKLYKFYIDNAYLSGAVKPSAGVTYDKYNYLKLVYSVYEGGTWSTPHVITGDINNEVEFAVTSDNSGIHIIYTRAKEILNKDNCSKFTELLDVYAISYNGTFSPAVCIGSADAYKTNLEIASINNEVYAAWTENSEYNVIGMSNEYTTNSEGEASDIFITDKNSVVFAVKGSDGWSTKSLGGLGLIADIAIGNGVVYAVLDKDCDVATPYDRTVNVISISDGEPLLTELVFTLDSDESLKEKVETETYTRAFGTAGISGINYEKGKLYIRGIKAIYIADVNGRDIKATMFVPDITSDYNFVYDMDGNLIGVIYTEDVSDYSSDLYVKLYIDGTFTNGICIVDNGDYCRVDYFDASVIDGEPVIIYKNMITELGTDSNGNPIEKLTYVINSENLNDEDFDLILSGVTVSTDKISVKTPFDITVTVRNDSLKTVNEVTVELLMAGSVIKSKVFTDVSILPGEISDLIFNVSLGENEISDNYTLRVIAGGELVDSNEENNVEAGVKLAYPDLTVNAKYVVVGDIKYMLVIVQNTGTLPMSGYTIYVANGILDADETIENALYELYCGTDSEARGLGESILPAGAYKYYTVELNKVYFTDDYVTLSVVAEEGAISESNTENNYMSFSMEQNEPVDLGKFYTLNYYVDNELVYTTTYNAGAVIKTSPVDLFTVKEGHTFSGWSGERETMPAHDLNVYGYFVANRYNVNYYVDGELAYTDSVIYGTDIPVRNQADREGHTFDGWYPSEEWTDGTEKFVFGKMGAEDISLYGKQNVNTYTISYYVDSSIYKTEAYKYGETIVLPVYSEPAGYEFSGWTLPSGVTTMPAYNINLYAVNQIRFYTLTYKVSTGGEYETVREIKVHFGGTIPYYDYQGPAGYSFGGWYDAIENGQLVQSSDNKKMPASDITLYGKNTARKYSVTYLVNDAEKNQVYVTYGERIPDYIYTFDDIEISTWLGLPDDMIMPARNIVVYNIATENLYTIDYYIDGVYMYTDSYPFAAEVKFRIPESKEGYTFSGWLGKDEFVDGNMPNKNVRLDGGYEINTYTVSYYVDYNLWKEVSYNYGADVNPEDYTAPQGYTFLGWSNIPTSMPANNVTVYGTTKVNQYSVNYYVGTELKHTSVVDYGMTIPSYTYNPPMGYTVSLWEGLEDTMPAKDIDVYATLIPREYTLTYYVDDEVVKTVKYKYGTEVQAYVYEAPEGKVFRGFNDIPLTMPAHDVSVYGQTEGLMYRLNYYIDNALVYTDIYSYDELITVRENSTRYGYTFSGWGNIDRRMPAHDVNVYGTFTKNSHSVNYYINDVLVHTDEYEFGDEIIAYAPDAIGGCTFAGWQMLPTVMQDEDVKVIGSYSTNFYTVSYYINDQFYKAVRLAYGSDIDLSLIEEENYAITAWTVDGKTVTELKVGTSDVRLDAIVEDTTPFVQKPAFAAIVTGVSTAGASVGAYFLIEWLKKRKLAKTITTTFDQE